MSVHEIIFASIGVVPIVRAVLHWSFERHLEIIFLDDPSPNLGFSSREIFHTLFCARILAKLINHRMDRNELILSCTLHLKRRRWLLWKQSLFSMDLTMLHDQVPLNTVLLGSLCDPMKLEITGEAIVPILNLVPMPNQMDCYLTFKMVGPIRRIERKVRAVKLNQERIDDKGYVLRR